MNKLECKLWEYVQTEYSYKQSEVFEEFKRNMYGEQTPTLAGIIALRAIGLNYDGGY